MYPIFWHQYLETSKNREIFQNFVAWISEFYMKKVDGDLIVINLYQAGVCIMILEWQKNVK